MTAGIPAVVKEITPTTTIYYYREPGGELLARQEGTTGSTRRYYHFDGLGSTSLLTNTNGDWTDKYSYDGWGNVLQHSTATGSINQPYQYVGQLGYYTHYMVPGSADFRLLQLGVRFYDPQVGRFTQKDPIKDGVNLYAYVEGNPVNGVDPSGKQPCSIIDKKIAFFNACVEACKTLLPPSLQKTKIGENICKGICGKWTFTGLGKCEWLEKYCLKLRSTTWYGPCCALYGVVCTNGEV